MGLKRERTAVLLSGFRVCVQFGVFKGSVHFSRNRRGWGWGSENAEKKEHCAFFMGFIGSEKNPEMKLN